jgi:hypothetical protein
MVTDTGVLDWKRDHPILRGLSLQKLYASEAVKLDVPPESEILMDGVKGQLIVLHREGRSMHLLVTFDLMQSNWPLRRQFPDLPAQRATVHGLGERHGRARALRARRHAAHPARQPPARRCDDQVRAAQWPGYVARPAGTGGRRFRAAGA